MLVSLICLCRATDESLGMLQHPLMAASSAWIVRTTAAAMWFLLFQGVEPLPAMLSIEGPKVFPSWVESTLRCTDLLA